MYCNKINDQKWVIFQTSHRDFGRIHQMSQRLFESFKLKILSEKKPVTLITDLMVFVCFPHSLWIFQMPFTRLAN